VTLPRFKPMLAVPWASPFSDPDWTFETKWDGMRAIVSWGGALSIRTRTGADATPRYPELMGLAFSESVVLDCEIVALDEAGVPSFERLQKRMHLSGVDRVARAAVETPVTLVAFDLLYRGHSVVDAPLEERRALLADLQAGPPMTMSESIDGDGLALWEAITARDIEGVVAKRLGSRYRPGTRSPDWRKIANVRDMRALVVGFTPGEGGRAGGFGALVLALDDGEAVRWVGNVGTGFTDAQVASIRSALDLMVSDRPRFHETDGLPEATWVEPMLVASIGYRDWTAAGRLRHPRFRGFTDDLSDAITWEAEGPGSG